MIRAHRHRNLGCRSARSSVRTVAAAVRPNYFPGSTPPKHLDGTMPGDYGFDPLGLGKNMTCNTVTFTSSL